MKKKNGEGKKWESKPEINNIPGIAIILSCRIFGKPALIKRLIFITLIRAYNLERKIL